MRTDTQSSVRETRTRLFLLLGRAFVIVLLLSVFSLLVSVSYFLTFSSNSLSTPFVGSLEGYYLGHGSWDGVNVVFNSNNELNSLNTILLDNEHRVQLDRRHGSGSTIGSIYNIQPHDAVFNLVVQDKKVGSLVISSFSLSTRLSFIWRILFPVGIISIILAMFYVVVAILFLRRFVNPLAEVIYAAHALSGGKLDTRIPVKGQQDLRSLSESFNEMASALERNDQERRALLADIAHELRTPLSVIRGRLEGIVDGIYSADGSQVSLALEQTYLLERLVDDLRLLTLVETHQLRFEKSQIDLANLAKHTLEIFSAEAREKNIALSLETERGNFQIELDPQRSEQVIGNLIGNSLRYIPAGGRIWLTLQETASLLRLCVNDNGPGVASEDLPYLFDRFWRKERSRSRTTGGTGLGLAIAKQLVEAQGGTIEARNLPEGGFQIVMEFKK